MTSLNDDSYCAIWWINSRIISTVHQSAIFKSPELTRVNDICFVEIEDQYQKGKILFIG
jgi:hypothetical protein